MKEFNSIEEMKPYYNKEKNLFYIDDDIKLNFNLVCSWDINARDIYAWDINAGDITAWDIKAGDINARDIYAWDIKARNIDAFDITALNIDARDIKAFDINALDVNYYAVCYAYKDIKCKSIKGRRKNCKHFVLDGEIIIKEEK